MGKTSQSRYDKFEIEEIRHARINRKKQPIKDRSSERRIQRALKTKNIDEYMIYAEENDKNEEDIGN